MATLAFELGYDWNVPPAIGVRDGVYSLQACLVDDDNEKVISPCYCDSEGTWSVQVKDSLYFRVYDFTDYSGSPPNNHPVPTCMQLLCSSTDKTGNLTPFCSKGDPVAQQAATYLTELDPQQSVAFAGTASFGWQVHWQTPYLGFSGRFNLRKLLTVAIPGEMARFYHSDQEMVVGFVAGGC